MPFYEVVYETGSHSVVEGDEKDVLRGIKEHHRRALNGEIGGPTGHPAERVKRIFVYDRHPADFLSAGSVSVEEAESRVKDAIKRAAESGVVGLAALQRELDQMVSPMHRRDEAGPHESWYKMKETKELKPSQWEPDSKEGGE